MLRVLRAQKPGQAGAHGGPHIPGWIDRAQQNEGQQRKELPVLFGHGSPYVLVP
ncbi:hypothetical protein D3C78_1945020 [compost metagenome]